MFRRLFEKNNETSTKPAVERYNFPSKVLCIFVSYNIDDDDIQFIEKNKDDCDMIVIESINAPSLSNMRMKQIKGIEYHTRPNIGYDATAWRDYILKNINRIRTYDYVILANNSCRYDFLIKNSIKAMQKKNATFYGLNRSQEITDHIQSFYIIVHKSLTNTPDFLDYWRLMPPVKDRQTAINNHELTFTRDMKKAGAIVDSMTTYDLVKNTYDPNVYHIGMGELPPFMKKKLLIKGANRTNYLNLLKQLKHMI